MNKRTLSDIYIMDVDDENSTKRMKTQYKGEIIRQDEQNLDDSWKIFILQQHHVQMEQYSFAGKYST